MLRFDKATCLLLLYKLLFILSGRLSISVWGSDILLFPEFINIVSILYYNFIEFIILLYTFLVIYFAEYKEYMIWWIWFSKFSAALPAFTCAIATGNIWSICLWNNFLMIKWSKTLATRGGIPGLPLLSVDCNGNIPLLKLLRTVF